MRAAWWMVVAAACGGGSSHESSSPLTDKTVAQLADAPTGIELALSEGKQGAAVYDRTKLAPATKLGDADAKALLARAQPIATDPDDTAAFALRPSSQPPPKPGATVTGSFPPPPSTLLPPKPDPGALRVVRYLPEGAVPVAPELSITFNQPMVAVTSQADAAATVPVKLSPQPPRGAWRWIGTRTLVFAPEVRFPQATTYTVEVPAGTASAAKATLAAPTKFTFETPPPTVVSHYPNDGSQRRDVPMFVLFDQKIDAAKVLAKIRVHAKQQTFEVRTLALDPAQLAKEKDKQFVALVENAGKNDQNGRWIAFRTAAELPADSPITIEIPPGTPSAEGPNVTKELQTYGFRTYAPLAVKSAECGYDHQCPPSQAFRIELNNPLDEDKAPEKQLAIAPDVPDVRIVANGNWISVLGATKARTTYKVTVGKALTDAFGQTLGNDETLTFTVGDALPTFHGPSGLVVLDPAAQKHTLDVYSTNHEQLKVKLYKVQPSMFDGYRTFRQQQWNHDKPPVMPGALVADKLLPTKPDRNLLVETAIDLAPALGSSGLGQVVAIVEPFPWREKSEPPRLVAWVQSTKLALDAFVDADTLTAFATELATGKPAANVALELVPFGITATTDDRGLATIALPASAPHGASLLVARRGDDLAFVSEDRGYWSGDGSWFKQPRPASTTWFVFDDRKMYKPGEDVAVKGWLREIDRTVNGDVRGAPRAPRPEDRSPRRSSSAPSSGRDSGVPLRGAPAADSRATSVSFTVKDERDNQIATGTAPISATGGFDVKFTLPKTPNLGSAWIDFAAAGSTHRHVFQIEEFRRPDFEVSAQASQGPFLVNGSGDVTVSAKYYSGGPLPGAPVEWSATATRTSYTPPNRDDYVFGAWVPWWGGRYASFDDDEDGGFRGRGGWKPPKRWTLGGKTDATGAHTLHLDFLSMKPAMPMSVNVSATVTDVNRQAWAAQATLLVHPSSLYVGLKTKKPFVEKGTPFELDVVGVDLDGKAVAGTPIEVKAVRLDWAYEKGRYVEKEADPHTCRVTSANDAQHCTIPTPNGGTYRVTATIADSKGRASQTTLTFWVSGGEQPAAREVAQERVQLIPDKKEYAAGNTAELLVQAPFYPAEGLVTWRRNGIAKTERITLTGPTKVITVPITEAMVPNLYVQVDLVGTAVRTDDKGVADPKLPRRPAYASGELNLPVPPVQRTLRVSVAPSAAKVSPGQATSLALQISDAAGRPVRDAEAAVIVVDESVLALSGYQFPNPIDTFYGTRSGDVRDYYLHAYIQLARPETTIVVNGTTKDHLRLSRHADNEMPDPNEPDDGERGKFKVRELKQEEGRAMDPFGKSNRNQDFSRRARGGKDGKDQWAPGQGAAKSIAVRTNFSALAAFAPAVKTDASGRATVAIKMPDSLTRYRIVAIAVAGDKQFGKGESAVTARLPLMVRPSPPRFLNFGDTFELPVVVQNQTDAPMTVKLAARATNATLTDGNGREVTVPANDRVEVRFPAAAELAGTARFQLVGSTSGAAGDASDAADVMLPVWTPATSEAFATYGTIDSGAVTQPVALPGKVVTQFGVLEVTTASTNLQALTDAMLYLVRYPYECAEQRSSRILAIAALRDVLTAFKTKDMPSPAALEASVKADVERLSQMQNDDGGFAYWDRGHPSEPYLSVHVTNALVRAKAKGFTVDKAVLERALVYARDVETHIPAYYAREISETIAAYALYTRKLAGDVDVAKAQKLLREAGGPAKLSLEADGWLLGTLAGNAAAASERGALVRHATNKVSETAGAASFTTSYSDGAYLILASDRRVDGVMLEALIQEQKDLDLIPKLVTGLLGHRKAGRWLNTQENSFALAALDLYFQTYEKVTPDFVARVWLGNDYAGDHAFRGRTTEDFAIRIPMATVATHDKQDLTIAKDGPGRLYYRVGMRYAPASLSLAPADYGFVVERRYEGADDPKDVRRDADGTWHIKAGARVRVRITMVNENRRYHVALVDPLPAGLEPMNPALAVTGPIPTDPASPALAIVSDPASPDPASQKSHRYGWYGTWYEHQNLRDDRVEAFASLLWEGVHAYDYVARATTPGKFVVPPPKAEEMYMPETFGRGGTDRVIVE